MIFISNEDKRLETVKLYTYEMEVDVIPTTTAPVYPGDIEVAEITQKESIFALRRLYRELGKEPSRYRSSVEALMRRVAQGKGLYAINNIVDAGNVLSLMLETSIGIYDADQIKGAVKLAVGGVEPYETIGKGMFNIASLPVLFDEVGPFGNPNSDSARTMVTEKTKKILVVVFVFDETVLEDDIHKQIAYFKENLSI